LRALYGGFHIAGGDSRTSCSSLRMQLRVGIFILQQNRTQIILRGVVGFKSSC
jgi:hypothetical protein